MKNNITIGEELQGKLLSGIEQVSSVIRQSYGPKGSNISIESNLYPYHLVANDAQSIIQSIYLENPVERRGLNFIKELSDKASKDSGDGRKTTIIIAEEILKGGFNAKVKGMQLKEELDSLLPMVLNNLDKQSKRIELEDIGMIAKTSSMSDEISEWISKMYQEIGRDGIIELEGSGSYTTSYKVTDGVKFSAGWLSASMVHDDEAIKEGRIEKQAIYEEPIILITKRKIEKDTDIAGLVTRANKENRPLVIFTDDMDNNVAFRLIATHKAKVANVLIIRAPVLFKNYVFEDFAKCVGATIVEDATGLNFKNLQVEHLGTCEKLICDRDETILRGIKDITAHKDALRAEGGNDSLLRLQWLNTKTAVFKLGAGSESELSYKRLKASDAVSSCRLAISEGIVTGGGKALMNAAKNLQNVKMEAVEIFIDALEAPYSQLLKNSNESIDAFSVLNTENVWDATTVIKNAVRNAVSLAGIVLTTGADVRLKDQTFEEKQLEILSKQRNPF